VNSDERCSAESWVGRWIYILSGREVDRTIFADHLNTSGKPTLSGIEINTTENSPLSLFLTHPKCRHLMLKYNVQIFYTEN
jgi:hypothetical protein